MSGSHRRGSTNVPILLLAGLIMLWAAPSAAQTGASGSAAQTQAAGAADPDLQTNVAEPDFTLGALPTTLRLPARAFAFRLTHRFTRAIGSGSAGDFFADFFGFDSSARVGIELRYGIRPGTQVVLHRTNDRSIQFLGQHELYVCKTSSGAYVVDAIAVVEGADNFSEDFSGTFGAAIARRFADRGTIYLQPLIVLNAAPLPIREDVDAHTLLLGVGGRWRLGQSRAYVLIEAAPQVAGYRAGVDHVSVGLEKRAGGHVFQLTISNALGTTLRQVARGGEHRGDWFIGFNLSRKFY